MKTLPQIEIEDGRKYIPLPGGWEVQTKGKGSTFRVCKLNEDGTFERWSVVDEELHEMLERMAIDIRTELGKNFKEGT